MKLLIVIPAFNEGLSLEDTVKSVIDQNFDSSDVDIEVDILIVNDGSTDNTSRVCSQIIKKYGSYRKIYYCELPFNIGIGGAMQTGYKFAYINNYDLVLQFDADGQHPAKYIKRLLDVALQRKANVVIGSRFKTFTKNSSGVSKLRKLGIKYLSWLGRIISSFRIYDITSGFRLVDRRVIAAFSKFYPAEYPEPITNIYLLKNKYRCYEESIKMKERVYGRSSIQLLKAVEYFFNVTIQVFTFGKFIEKNNIGGVQNG